MFKYVIVILNLFNHVSGTEPVGKCTVKSDLDDSRLNQLVNNNYETTFTRNDGKKSKFRFNFCGDGLSYQTASVEQVRFIYSFRNHADHTSLKTYK